MHAAIHMKRDHRRNEMPIVGRTVQISSIEHLDRILELVSTWLLNLLTVFYSVTPSHTPNCSILRTMKLQRNP